MVIDGGDPHGIAVDSMGNIYIADLNNYCIRMVTSDGLISALVHEQDRPTDVKIDPNGGLFMVEQFAGRVLKLE